MILWKLCLHIWKTKNKKRKTVFSERIKSEVVRNDMIHVLLFVDSQKLH